MVNLYIHLTINISMQKNCIIHILFHNISTCNSGGILFLYLLHISQFYFKYILQRWSLEYFEILHAGEMGIKVCCDILFYCWIMQSSSQNEEMCAEQVMSWCEPCQIDKWWNGACDIMHFWAWWTPCRALLNIWWKPFYV